MVMVWHHFYPNWVIRWLTNMCRKFSTAPANSTAAANSNDNFSENFVHEINSTAQYYPRKYGIVSYGTYFVTYFVCNLRYALL